MFAGVGKPCRLRSAGKSREGHQYSTDQLELQSARIYRGQRHCVLRGYRFTSWLGALAHGRHSRRYIPSQGHCPRHLWSTPRELTNVNGTLFFSADDGGSTRRELWKSDGTTAGTVLVKDIWPGLGSSSPRELTNVNGTLFFSAREFSNNFELWKSDGTAAGTVLVNLDKHFTACGNSWLRMEDRGGLRQELSDLKFTVTSQTLTEADRLNDLVFKGTITATGSAVRKWQRGRWSRWVPVQSFDFAIRKEAGHWNINPVLMNPLFSSVLDQGFIRENIAACASPSDLTAPEETVRAPTSPSPSPRVTFQDYKGSGYTSPAASVCSKRLASRASPVLQLGEKSSH